MPAAAVAAVAAAAVARAGKGGPNTILKGKPPKRTADRTPTFRFRSNEEGATFQCKLDGKPYKKCRSPFTRSRASALGSHTFRVRARHGGDTRPLAGDLPVQGLLEVGPASGR